MKKPFGKIMLVTNEPSCTAGAEQTAINLAKANNAKVLLVDSIKTPFHAPRFPSLSTELMYESALGAKKAYLEKVKAKFSDAKIETTCKVLVSPRTSTELINTAMKEEAGLVIRYMKGRSSRAAGRYGETAENLMRACPVPVLLTEKEILDPKVVACINLEHGPKENQSILEGARRLVNSLDDLFIVACWEFSGRDFFFDYMDSGMQEQTRVESAKMYSRLFERFRSVHNLHELGDRVQLIDDHPTTAIPQFCKERSIDVAVMCSASLNHPLGRKLGSTIERMIGLLPCALLTVKPVGFLNPQQP